MDWLSNVRKQAHAATEKLVSSETAGRARQLAAQAKQQATALAKGATAKAQEVAKEAISEAERGLAHLRQPQAQSAKAADPLQYGITPELQQFVRSLTYSTFSDYPLDSLDLPSNPAEQQLGQWQEMHARLVLQQVPQLQDLRFVLCPRRMDEYTFWMVYFTLCKRYLPSEDQRVQPMQRKEQPQLPGQQHQWHEQQQQQQQQSVPQLAPVASRALAADTRLPLSSVQDLLQQDKKGDFKQPASGLTQHTDAEAQGSVQGSEHHRGADGHELAALANDPELDAYLQDALQLDEGDEGHEVDGATGSDIGDFDEYINQMDAGESKP